MRRRIVRGCVVNDDDPSHLWFGKRRTDRALDRVGGRFHAATTTSTTSLRFSRFRLLNPMACVPTTDRGRVQIIFTSIHRTGERVAALTALLKIVVCLTMSAAAAFTPWLAMWWLMRASFHSGMLSYLLGVGVYQEYRKSM